MRASSHSPGAFPLCLSVLLAVWMLGVSCSRQAAPSGEESVALGAEYDRLQQEALAEVRRWQVDGGRKPDPRPALADRLEAFAREHPGTEEAADAVKGVMEMRAARFDTAGFFASYELLLKIGADSPALRGAFANIPLMRLAEIGGPFILQSPDPAARKAAYVEAVPAIVADLRKAIVATTDPTTIAAAHYAIASTYYQLEVDPERALAHFRIVALQYPNWQYADSAREYVRELEDLAVGRTAPDFSATGLRGAALSLSSLRGQVVLVDFWATWCRPCVDELPNLQEAYDRFKADGFTILGVSLDEDLAAVDEFMRRHRVEWPTTASGKGLSDPVTRLYHVQAIPMSYLVDRRGVIRGRALLGRDVETAVAELIDRD